MTAVPEPSHVADLQTRRARKLLDDMITHPFCVLIFDGDSISGITKELDSDQSRMVRELIETLS